MPGLKPAEEDVVMSARLKRRIVIAAVVLGVVGLGGTALGASSSSGNPFLGDVAKRLGISQSKLQTAINGAVKDQLNQLVKDGKLTQAQANAIEKRMQQKGGAGLPAFGFGRHDHFDGPRPGFGFGFRFGGRGTDSFQTAAKYLGVSESALMSDLRSGKTLAAVAKAQGKSVSGLETAMIAPAKSKLDAAVKDGHMSKTQETRFLKMLSDGIDRLVTKGFPKFDGGRHHGFDDGPWGAPKGGGSNGSGGSGGGSTAAFKL
jgi:AraC-like DNA-binding protein